MNSDLLLMFLPDVAVVKTAGYECHFDCVIFMLSNSRQSNLPHSFYESDKLCVKKPHSIFIVF